MNTLVDSALSGAVTVLIQSTLLLGSALALGWWLRGNSSLRHAVLLSALLLTFLMAGLAVWNPHRIQGIQVLLLDRASTTTDPASLQPRAEPTPALLTRDPAWRHLSLEGSSPPPPPSELAVAAASAASTPVPAPAGPGYKISWRRAGVGLLVLWAIGSAFLAIRLFLGLSVVHRLVRNATPVPRARAHQLWREVAGAIGASASSPRPIFTSSRISGPMVVGAFRPRVFIPEAMLDDLAGPRLQAVLAHEIAHVLRRDTLVGILERWVQILLWPQPLLGMLLNSLDRAREEICDNYALAVADRRAYGRLLLDLTPREIPSLQVQRVSAGLLKGRRNLEHRISGILNPNRNTMTKPTLRQWIAPTAVIATIAIMAGGTRISFAQEDGERNEREPRRERERTEEERPREARAEDGVREQAERPREEEGDRFEARVAELRAAMREASERGQEDRAHQLEKKLKALFEEHEGSREAGRGDRERGRKPERGGDRFEAQVDELRAAMREAAERGQEDRAHQLEKKLKALFEEHEGSREAGREDAERGRKPERGGDRFEAQVRELRTAMHEAAERGQEDRAHQLEQKLKALFEEHERSGQARRDVGERGREPERDGDRFEAQVRELQAAVHEAAERGQKDRAHQLEQRLEAFVKEHGRSALAERERAEREHDGESENRAAQLERRLIEMAKHMEEMQRSMQEMRRELERLRNDKEQ